MTGIARYRWALAVAGICLAMMAGIVVLYAIDVAKYRALLTLWGLHVEFEPYFPFVDLSEYLTSIHLGAAGAPVFTDANPGNPWHHRHTYPIALWLWNYITPNARYTNLIGLALGAASLTVASLIARPANAKEALLCLPMIAAPSTVYAIERGNMDQMMFLVAAAGSLLLSRPAIRAAGYAVLMLGGLLKFYPLTAMAVALGERPRRFAIIAVTSIVVFGSFLLLAGPELRLLLHNRIVYFLLNDSYGAANAFAFFVVVAGADQGYRVTGPIIAYLALVLFVFGFAAVEVRRGQALQRPDFAFDPARTLFVVGGMMEIFLFFFFLNTTYRGILLLLLLPWLLIKRRGGDTKAARMIWLAIFVSWSEFIRNHLGAGPPEFVSVVLLREPAWWWLMALLVPRVWAEIETMATMRAFRHWVTRTFDRQDHGAESEAH
jgi:hypothetical protein